MSNWRERLDEYGVPSDAITEGVREVLGDITGQASKLQQAINSNPVLAQNGEAVGAYLSQTPELQHRLAGMMDTDPGGAMDYLSLRFQAARGGPAQRGDAGSHPMGSVFLPMDRDFVAESMAKRGYTPSPDGVFRQPQPPTQAPAEPQAPQPYSHAAAKAHAWQEYQRTGSKQAAEAYGHLRLRESISDEFLNQ